MIDDIEENAHEELKRADHLIYVTLKYTRTADVIKNTIKRLISAFDFSILEVLMHLKKKRKVPEVPPLPKLRAELVQKIMPQMKNEIEFYVLLKIIDKAEYSKKEEYRKNVALLAYKKPGEILEVNTETLLRYFRRTVAFVEAMDKIIHS